ncbi:biotin-independent malonate decarboxylase subunit gamma [Bordetella genomosp. 9]|uniref:Biotin-independent malonate decarboxylase subunit gamma n=1 Tax=Bordetella genomosp. 9 TaxID=1416803 RepID=A0A261R2D5_9BORD|nr:biotin-independent malonate decarboxylase subunit gamma [Bordetella genomosp. 9]OZI18887.1 biotin-independent malonate decarboxylase subunit gamma [Bordetella genomosp. 9]
MPHDTSTTTGPEHKPSRGQIWIAALTAGGHAISGRLPSVVAVDSTLADAPARYIAVVPDPSNPFPRARNGEVGLLEGWSLAQAVREVMTEDADHALKRPIVAIVDVVSQAYGRREEAFGIHQALAGAAAAYAEARQAGHPVIALLVGKAMSGAFLAHGYQANRLVALDDAEVSVHAMGKEAAARITQRSVTQLEALAAEIAPMAYDIASYASLGLLWRLLRVQHAGAPTPADIAAARSTLEEALADIRADPETGLESRRGHPGRQMSNRVRARLQELWAE